MNRYSPLILLLLIVSAFAGKAQQEARLLRFPSTNGTDVVFTYAGDLYKASLKGGEAIRMTSHIGYEMFAKFSPDGRTIAFTGEYDGNTEVYAMSSDGGEPVRVTYTQVGGPQNPLMGAQNIVMGWTVDGKNILYRNTRKGPRNGLLYTIPVEGGQSEPIPLPEGGFCSYSPDGSKLAYNKIMREFRTWKYYEGGQADEIWVYDSKEETVTNITGNEHQDIIPMWVGDNIFFLSDRESTMNMFVYNTISKQTSKVTDFTDFDVKFPSAYGNTIVFENGGYLYKMDATERKPERIDITLFSDNLYARSAIKNGSGYVSAVSISPDGKRAMFTTRGEIFDVPVSKGVTINITRTPGVHERAAKWSPDGKTVAYISDKTGETEVWLYDVGNGKHKQLTKKNDAYIYDIQWSADSKKIFYFDQRNRIVLIDVGSQKKTVVIESPVGPILDPVFSSDSKWLAYSRIAGNSFRVVYAYNIATKKEYKITDEWYSSYSPLFSTDGKYLFFTSEREFSFVHNEKEWNPAHRTGNALYMALLEKDTPSPFLGENPEVNPKKKDKKEGEVTEGGIKIDPEGIADRIIHVPAGPAGRPLYSDGKKVYYMYGSSTWMYDLVAKKDTEIAPSAMLVSPGTKKVVFYNESKFYVHDLPGGKQVLANPVDLSNMKITTDYAQEWKQIFNEAWRSYRDWFYVDNMHGVDWPAMKQKYEVLLPYVKNRLDLDYVIGEMVAELNVGHCYVSPGEAEYAKTIRTGLLGGEISRHKSGFFRIDKILQGASWSSDLRSPLAQPGVEAKVGDYIVAINGIPTNSASDIYELLMGKVGVLTELSLNKKPKLAGARKVVVSPISNEYSLYEYEWVQENIRRVDEATDGRVGYIYLPDMSERGLNEFAKYFYPQLEKEGLIIDDRYNGGGNMSPVILERLAREPYRMTMHRGWGRTWTVPVATQVGPKVCLINKYAGSDGDLFPWGFRALGLGKLIGTRTWGGIVGITNGSPIPYMDGTQITVPLATSYDPKTGEWIIENHGVDPDIEIDNDPILQYKGVDQQLDRAIKEILKELETRQPLPPVPAPRVWNK